MSRPSPTCATWPAWWPTAAAPQRTAALGRLYRALALFVADNFQHMQVEETAHNAVLWAAYRDDELMAIEQAIVASIPPDAMAEALHWFLPALTPRACGHARRHAPRHAARALSWACWHRARHARRRAHARLLRAWACRWRRGP
jgi:hypothetical protein